LLGWLGEASSSSQVFGVVRLSRVPVIHLMRKPEFIQTRRFRLVLLITACLTGFREVNAQFLRLGPLDFDAQASLDSIYTTNVEGQRESEATDEREDIYFVFGFDLLSAGIITPDTDLNIKLGVSFEKHINRPDLDNSSSPFANASVSLAKEVSRWRFNADATYERTTEAEEDVVFLGGESAKTRREHDIYGYGAGVDWSANLLTLGLSYDFTAERYIKEEEKFADRDDETINFNSNLKLTERISLGYDRENKRTDLINDPDDDDSWELTQRIFLQFQLLRKPNLTYAFGYEKEDEGDWEMIHTFNITDSFDLSSNVKLSLAASYDIEEVEEEDDIGFRYGAVLTHQISPTAEQSFSAQREPAETFGSSTDTDAKTFTYNFRKDDLFIYGLGFGAGVSYQINTPLEDDAVEEKIWTYTAVLSHSAAVSRKLSRKIEYSYSLEDTNTNDEILDEHRVTWSYVYDF